MTEKTVIERHMPERRVTVDWRTASARIVSPAAVEFQRVTSRWLGRIRAAARGEAIQPARIGEIDADVLDQLRSPILIRGAAALGALHLIEAIFKQYPPESHEFRNLPSTPDFQRLFAWASKPPVRGDSAEIESAPTQLPWPSRIRHSGFQIKQTLRRNFGIRRTVPASVAPRVLALPRLDGQVTDMLPVVDLLRNCHQIETVFAIVDNRLARRIKDAGYPCLGLYKCTAVELRGIKRVAAEQTTRLAEFLRRQFDDEELSALQVRALADATGRVLQEEMRDVVHLNTSCQRILTELRPSLLLTGNPYTMEGRVAATVARQLDVPTAAMEHGTIFADSPMWYECPLDIVCAWGEPSCRALESAGLSEEQIRVTGAPRYDAIFQRNATRIPKPEFILVATSGAGDQVNLDQQRAFIRILHEAAELTPEIRWVVKLHPKDREELYAYGDALSHPRVTVTRAESGPQGLGIFGYLDRAAAVVTITSSSALDAMAVGVPVIAIDVWAQGQKPRGIEFLHNGCTRTVRTGPELAAETRKAWQGEQHQETQNAAKTYADEHFANRGRAAEVTARELAAIAARK